MRRFQVHGLSIASEFELSFPEDSDSAAPAIMVTRAHPEFFNRFLSTQAVGDYKPFRYETLPDGSCHLTWNDLFDFLIAPDGSAIVCGPRADTSFEPYIDCLVAEPYISYLIGFALSFALLLAGEEALHATVIESSGQAIGFLGDSGAGKSTLASYFLGKGCRLITDDLLRITFRKHLLIAHPGPQRIKLFPESADEFMERAAWTDSPTPFTMKRLIALPADQRMESGVPLKALFLLNRPENINVASSIGAERLRRAEAILKVVASTFNAAVETPDRLARQLRFVGQILDTIPLIRLSYPRRFDVLSSVYDLVVQGHWQ
jgi:hypothetical protein